MKLGDPRVRSARGVLLLGLASGALAQEDARVRTLLGDDGPARVDALRAWRAAPSAEAAGELLHALETRVEGALAASAPAPDMEFRWVLQPPPRPPQRPTLSPLPDVDPPAVLRHDHELLYAEDQGLRIVFALSVLGAHAAAAAPTLARAALLDLPERDAARAALTAIQALDRPGLLRILEDRFDPRTTAELLASIIGPPTPAELRSLFDRSPTLGGYALFWLAACGSSNADFYPLIEVALASRHALLSRGGILAIATLPLEPAGRLLGRVERAARHQAEICAVLHRLALRASAEELARELLPHAEFALKCLSSSDLEARREGAAFLDLLPLASAEREELEAILGEQVAWGNPAEREQALKSMASLRAPSRGAWKIMLGTLRDPSDGLATGAARRLDAVARHALRQRDTLPAEALEHVVPLLGPLSEVDSDVLRDLLARGGTVGLGLLVGRASSGLHGHPSFFRPALEEAIARCGEAARPLLSQLRRGGGGSRARELEVIRRRAELYLGLAPAALVDELRTWLLEARSAEQGAFPATVLAPLGEERAFRALERIAAEVELELRDRADAVRALVLCAERGLFEQRPVEALARIAASSSPAELRLLAVAGHGAHAPRDAAREALLLAACRDEARGVRQAAARALAAP
ncbi:MAG: hypothetical protein IPN34_24805 [Planctomycetes bacterium]|nr:hypothetical protein [Planctomycetota bacterium]